MSGLTLLACGVALALPPAAQSVQLSRPRLITVGDVSDHALSPDNQWVVYVADEDVDGELDLYSVPADGSAPAVRLNGAPASGAVVVSSDRRAISADSQRVVYAAEDLATGVYSLFSVPIAGGASVKLSGATAIDTAGVAPFKLSLDSSRVVYSSAFRLYSVPIGGGTSQQLSQSLLIPTGHGTFIYGDYSIAPDSARVVFKSDELGVFSFQLHSIPIDGGAAVRLDPPGHNAIGAFEAHPDGRRVAFVSARAGTSPTDPRLFSVPIDGGKALALTPTHDSFTSFRFAPGGEHVAYLATDAGFSRNLYTASVPSRVRSLGAPSEIRITPLAPPGRTLSTYSFSEDGARLVYLSNQDQAALLELYSAPCDGSAAPIRLNHALLAGGGVSLFRIGTGGNVFHMTDSGPDAGWELFRVPIGGGANVQLSPAFVAGGNLTGFELSESHVAYRADQDIDETFELFVVPQAGGASVRLNPPLYPGLDVQTSTARAGGRVIYVADQDENETFALHSAPLAGGGDVRLSGTFPVAAEDDVERFVVVPAGSSALYLADEDADDWNELYSTPLDGTLAPVKVGPSPSFLGKVFDSRFTPDGSGLAFLGVTDSIAKLYTCPLDSSTPPLEIAAPPAQRVISDFAVSSLGGHVAYYAVAGSDRDLYSAPTDGSGVTTRLDDGSETLNQFWIVDGDTRVLYLSRASAFRLITIPIGGGTRVQLHPSLTSGRFIEPTRVTPDLQRVVFRSDLDVDDVYDLWSAPVDGSVPAVKLNSPLALGRSILYAFALSADGARAVYAADQEVDGQFQLYSVPVDGSAAPTKLSGTLALKTLTVSTRAVFQVSPTSDRVVFLRDDARELYSAPIDGSAPPTLLNPPLVGGGTFYTSGEWTPYQVSPDGQRVLYVAGQDTSGKNELYSVPIDASAAAVKVSPVLASNQDVNVSQRNFENGASAGLLFSPDSQRVVFRISPTSELFDAPVDGSAPALRLHPPLVSGGDVQYFEVHGYRALYLADQDQDEVDELHSSALGD